MCKFCKLKPQNNNTPLNELGPVTIPLPKMKKKRLKVWDLEPRFHCSILGTCLTLKELRQIARKTLTGSPQLTDYQLHVSFVNNMDQNDYINKLLNKHLDKKYRPLIQKFMKTTTEKQRIILWNEALESGEVAGAFWAIVSHPESSADFLYYIYGEIHMLSHINGASLRVDMKKFHQLKQKNLKNEQLAKQTKDAHTNLIKEKNTEIEELKKQLRDSKLENDKLLKAQSELDSLKNTPLAITLKDKLNKQITHNTSLLKEQEDMKNELELSQAQQLKDQVQLQKLSALFKQANLENQALQGKLTTQQSRLTEADDRAMDSCSSCLGESTSLCGKCVLYVGGRKGQHSHFRELVESFDGRFLYHDGGKEDCHQQLVNCASKADVVLCPLDCVSHSAMFAVRNHCQKNEKPIVFMPHASLSSFSKGLDEVMTTKKTDETDD